MNILFVSREKASKLTETNKLKELNKYMKQESSGTLWGVSFQLLRRAEGPFWPKGYCGGRGGRTDRPVDKGFKGVR